MIIRYPFLIQPAKAAALLLGLLFALGSLSAAAQRPLRALPAAANPPQQQAEEEAQAEQQIPNPPGRARAAQLVEKIRARPGGRERADAAANGVRPEQANPAGGRGRQWGYNVTAPLGGFLAHLRSWLIDDAHAQSFSVELTPQVDRDGAHAGLRSSSPSAYAYLYGGYIFYYRPRNDHVFLYPMDTSYYGGSSGRTHPLVRLAANVPNDGWYIVNMNCSCGTDVAIRHYESGSGYTLLEQIPRQSGWADYPTLEYLSAGYHYFTYAPSSSSSMYVSRLTVESYR